MSLLKIDPAGYAAASALVGTDFARTASSVYGQLKADLAHTALLAGNDDQGLQWGASYSSAGFGALQSISALQQAGLALGALLQQSGFNHGQAESLSISRPYHITTTNPADYSTVAPLQAQCTDIPVAIGLAADYPTGWSIVRATVGFEWPTGHQGRLRAAATAWRTASTGLFAASSSIELAIDSVQLQSSPEVPHVVQRCRVLLDQIGVVSQSLDTIADECEQFAAHIDQVHDAVIDLLEDLASQTVLVEGVGFFTSFFTLGTSEIPTQLAEGAAVTRIALAIRDVLVAFRAFMVERIGAVAGVEFAAGEATSALSPLITAERVEAGLTSVQNAERLERLGDVVGEALDGVQPSLPQRAAAPGPVLPARWSKVDLQFEENAGGHTIRQHVGRTLDQLKSRTGKPESSSFYDEETATKAIEACLGANRADFAAWLTSKSGGNFKKVFDTGHPVGIVYVAATDSVRVSTEVRVVVTRGGNGQPFLLTAFPN